MAHPHVHHRNRSHPRQDQDGNLGPPYLHPPAPAHPPRSYRHYSPPWPRPLPSVAKQIRRWSSFQPPRPGPRRICRSQCRYGERRASSSLSVPSPPLAGRMVARKDQSARAPLLLAKGVAGCSPGRDAGPAAARHAQSPLQSGRRGPAGIASTFQPTEYPTWENQTLASSGGRSSESPCANTALAQPRPRRSRYLLPKNLRGTYKIPLPACRTRSRLSTPRAPPSSRDVRPY